MTWEPGQYFLSDEPVIINRGKPSIELNVWNVGDRAIQVGSHFHFFEVNKALEFNRGAALGTRLDIPAGTTVRFEPGDPEKCGFGGPSGFAQGHGSKRVDRQQRRFAFRSGKSGAANEPTGVLQQARKGGVRWLK